MEIMHLPHLERLSYAKSEYKDVKQKSKEPQPRKTSSPDSAYESSASEDGTIATNTPTVPLRETVMWTPSSGIASMGSSASVTDLNDEVPETLSLPLEPGQSESTTDDTDSGIHVPPDFYGIIHGPEYSLVTVKILENDTDTESIDQIMEDNCAPKDIQTVAMPMLWNIPSVPPSPTESLTGSLTGFPTESSSVTFSASSVSLFIDHTDGISTRPSSSLHHQIITQDDSKVPLSCLESSRQQLWQAVNACRAYLRI